VDGDEDPRIGGDGDARPNGDRQALPGGDGDWPSGDDDAAIAASMSALFDTVLADEPPSAVTPLTVLRRAQLEQQDRRYRRVAAVRRWGGGLVAAAAVVAAVVLLAPTLFNRSAPSAGSASATTAVSGPTRAMDLDPSAAAGSASGDSSGGSGSGAGGAASGGSGGNDAGDGSAEGAPAPDAPGRGSEPVSGTSAASGSSSAAASTSAAASGGNSPHTAPETVEGTPSDAPGAECPLPALLPANRAAAVSALPADVLTGIGSIHRCQPGDVRGTEFQLTWPDSTVTVVLSRTAECRTCSRDDSHPLSVTSADRSVTVSAGRDGITVRVTANPAAAAHLSQEQLTGIVTAVLDSNR
jgi:hypothetical protein